MQLKINTILVPTDFSTCASHALLHAELLANQFKAQIHLLHVDSTWTLNFSDVLKDLDFSDVDISEQLRLTTKAQLNKLAHQKDSKQVVSAHVEASSAADGIRDYAQAHDIDLIVMGAHGRRGINRLYIGSVAEEVVRTTTCPVMTIREELPLEKGIQHILVPVDFSTFSSYQLSIAKELAAIYDAQLDVLHVVEHPNLPFTGKFSGNALPNQEKQAMEAFKKIDTSELNVHAQFHVRTGHPVIKILDFIKEQNVDLILIGTHGRTGIKRLLLGSVAEKIVRTAPCIVTTIPGFGKAMTTNDSLLTNSSHPN